MKLFIIITFLTLISFESKSKDLLVVTENWPPYNYLDSKGKLTGESTEVVNKILSNASISFDISLYPWARSLQIASDRKNTLIYSIYKTKERENKFHWFCPILKPTPMHFYKMTTNQHISANDITDIKNYTVGINRSDWIHSHLSSLGFIDGKHLDLAAETQVNINKLVAGRIDLIVNSELGMQLALKKHNLPTHAFTKLLSLDLTGKNDLCMAINKQSSPELIKKITQAFNRLKDKV